MLIRDMVTANGGALQVPGIVPKLSMTVGDPVHYAPALACPRSGRAHRRPRPAGMAPSAARNKIPWKGTVSCRMAPEYTF
jgi:hypothetical protein